MSLTQAHVPHIDPTECWVLIHLFWLLPEPLEGRDLPLVEMGCGLDKQ